MRRNLLFASLAIVLAVASAAWIGVAPAVAGDMHKDHMDKKDATRIHLTEKNGYFEAAETLMNLEPGHYVFEVKNDAGKMAGFLVQDLKTQETLAMGPIEPGQTKEYAVEVSKDGFRYRCPINPTPWYEVSVGKM